MNKKTLTQLKEELRRASSVDFCEEVMALKRKLLEGRKPEIDRIKAEIEGMRKARPEKKPRWPESTPENVLAACKNYWKGTTEAWTFRIHGWNSKSVWTSYPSGGYSNNGGWNPTPAMFYLINLTDSSAHSHVGVLAELEGRTSPETMAKIMLEKTGEEGVFP